MRSNAELAPESKPSSLQTANGWKVQEAAAAAYFDPTRVLTRHGATGSSTRSHASTLDRMSRSPGSQPGRFLLQLQQQYGNQHVQRVLAIARQEGEGRVTPDVESVIERESAQGFDLQTERGDVFALLDESGESDDQGDEVGILQRQDDGGIGGDAGTPCAHPVNFTLGAAHDSGPDAIQIPITWDSSTGNLADLGSCTLREVVNYDPIPNPPFLWNPPNPTILSVPGTAGVAQDTHSYPPGLQNGITDPRQSGTMVAHQVYQCKCTGPGCSGVWEDIPGQTYTITRSVFPQFVRPNPWRYSITKSGVTNGFREVEVPPPGP